MLRSAAFLAVVVFSALAPPAAYAQVQPGQPTVVTVVPTQPEPLPPRWQRMGQYFGLALGLGRMDCQGAGCDGFVEGATLDFEFGMNPKPNVGWAIGVTSASAYGSHVSQWHNAANISAKAWLTPRIWVQAGAGIALASYYYDDFYMSVSSYSDFMPAYVLGAGIELVSSPWFALDVRMKWNQSFYDLFFYEDTEIEDLTIAFGATWF